MQVVWSICFQDQRLSWLTDQPLLYAFFNLAMAIAGDLGIAISLAAEGTLVRSRLHTELSGYPNADEVGLHVSLSPPHLTYL